MRVNVVAFTGAGISKASGIPTFEELGDIRDKLSRDFFIKHPEEVYEMLRMLRDASDQAEPNAAHLALARHGVPVVTMNVDGLHARAGSIDCIEVHGNLREVSCPDCRRAYGFKQVYQSILCPKCDQVLEPDVVLYGDMIPQYAKAVDKVCSAKRLLVVGTSFYTSTAHMAMMAKDQGIPTTIINEDAEHRVLEWLNKNLRL